MHRTTNLEVLSRSEEMLRAIQKASKVLGLPIDSIIAEFGPGQFEINFHHTGDVLSAADTAVIFRRLVRGVADEHGMEATFIAKHTLIIQEMECIYILQFLIMKV